MRLPYPSLCAACLKVQWAAVSKPLLCWEHSGHFPTSPLGQHCVGSLLLNFRGQKRFGVLIRNERSKLMCCKPEDALKRRIQTHVWHASTCIRLPYPSWCVARLTVQWTAVSKLRHCMTHGVMNFWVQTHVLRASECSELHRACYLEQNLLTKHSLWFRVRHTLHIQLHILRIQLTFFNLSILHHLLRLSFLTHPASTSVSNSWKKLICGVIRSFSYYILLLLLFLLYIYPYTYITIYI